MFRKIFNVLLPFSFGFSFCSFAQEAQLWEDPACELVKSDLKLQPEALLKAFLEKDSRGEFLGSNPWMDKAIACPGHLEGPDEAYVISSYKIIAKNVSSKSAKFTVRYEVLGALGSGGRDGELTRFTPERKPLDVQFKAELTPFGWKFVDFLWRNVLPPFALKKLPHPKWVPGDREKFMKATGLK